jgi:hypothetical protein
MKYAKSNDGLVHLLSVLHTEYTLCGNSYDGDQTDGKSNPFAHHPCKDGPVTCPLCVLEIKNVIKWGEGNL